MTQDLHRYRFHGLTVASTFALEEAEEEREARPPQLRIVHEHIPRASGDGASFRSYHATGQGDLIAYSGVGRFLVRGGAAIGVDIEPSFDRRLIGLPLLGPVIAMSLHRRGQLVMHGSAVEIAGRAHIFLGDKGAGKSTTAAALVAAGHRLIADDVVGLEVGPDGEAMTWSGCPAMKLEPAMLEWFDEAAYRVLCSDTPYTGGKLRVRLNRQLPDGPIPIGGVHAIARGAEESRVKLDGRETLHLLIRFSHYPRLGGAALAPAETADLFRRAAALSRIVPADRLTVREGIDELRTLGALLSSEGSVPVAA